MPHWRKRFNRLAYCWKFLAAPNGRTMGENFCVCQGFYSCDNNAYLLDGYTPPILSSGSNRYGDNQKNGTASRDRGTCAPLFSLFPESDQRRRYPSAYFSAGTTPEQAESDNPSRETPGPGSRSIEASPPAESLAAASTSCRRGPPPGSQADKPLKTGRSRKRRGCPS
jgi:hypothetical protein